MCRQKLWRKISEPLPGGGNMASENARLFIGIGLPKEHQVRLTDMAQRLLEELIQGNVTRTGNFHLTLKFLGETPRDRIPQMKAAIQFAAEKSDAFVLTLGTLGYFSKGRERIYWLGGEPSRALSQLKENLDKALGDEGEPAEEIFTPHVTLIRRGIPEKDKSWKEVQELIRPQELTHGVDRVVLFESTRISGLLTYVPLAEFPLK